MGPSVSPVGGGVEASKLALARAASRHAAGLGPSVFPVGGGVEASKLAEARGASRHAAGRNN
jgi:hypothetical protein